MVRPSKKISQTIFIEYESDARDFLWRFLLSRELSLRGWDVYFGWRFRLQTYCLKLGKCGDIYFAKDMFDSRLAPFKEMRGLGVNVVVLDEEELSVYGWPGAFLHGRLGETRNVVDDLMCFSRGGVVIVREISKKGQYTPHLYEVSHPRFLCGIPNECNTWGPDNLKTDRILIAFSSTFGSQDYLEDRVAVAARQVYPGNRQLIKKYVARVRNFHLSNKKLLRLGLTLASQMKDVQFRFRFHPGQERSWLLKAQEKLKRTYANISFSNLETPISSEFSDSTILLHTNCTTGVDAYFSKIRAIHCYPLDPWDSDEKKYQDMLGVPAFDIDRVRSLIASKAALKPVYKNVSTSSVFFSDPSFIKVLHAFEDIALRRRLIHRFEVPSEACLLQKALDFIGRYGWSMLGRVAHLLKTDGVFARCRATELSQQRLGRTVKVELVARSIVRLS